MVDRARFDVILGDRVSTSARRQAAALNELTKAFTATSAAARAASSITAPSIISNPTRARSPSGAASRAPARFDADGRAARAVAQAQAREAAAQQRQQRARVLAQERAASQRVRDATRVRRAVEQAQAKIAREERAATRAQQVAQRRAETSRARDQKGSFGSQLFGGFTRAGLAVGAVMAVAGAARAAASEFAQLSFDAAGAYMNIASFRQDSITALTTVMGNNAAAQRTFRNALVVANQTPLDPQQVIESFTAFSVGGFGERELAPLVAAASDISAARGQAASDSLVRVLTQIRGLGRVTRGDITMQALSAGLNAGDIFGDIARQMNLGTGAAGLRAAEKAVTQGRVTDTVAIAAFMASVRRRYDNGGALGTFARNSSNTLTGATSNLRGSMFALLGSANLEATPGIRSVTQAILGVTSALDMGSTTGQRFRGVIIGAADAVGVGLFGGLNEGTMKGAFEFFLPVLEGGVGILRTTITLGRAFVGGFLPGLRVGLYPVLAVIRSFRGGSANIDILAVAFRGLGRGVGFLVGASGSLIAFGVAVVGALTGPAVAIASLPGMLAGAADSVYTWGTGAAESIITGFETGMMAGVDRMVSAVTAPLEATIQGARDTLGWHSPSTVFRAAGEAVGQGFELGVRGGSGAARSAVAQLVGGGVGAGLGGASGATARTPIVVNIHIDGRGKSDEDLVDSIVEKLTDAFEGYALQGATTS